MEEVQSSLTLANQLEENGQIKDAYILYVSLAEGSLSYLKNIKFVQSAIISQPKQYASLISAMRTCLSHMEHIIETHSPGTSSKILAQHTGDSNKIPKPPLPPKPSRIHKPVLPPKPTRGVMSRPSSPTNDEYLQDKSSEHSQYHQTQQQSVEPVVRPKPPLPNTLSNSRPYSVPSSDNRSLQKHRPLTEIRPPSDNATIISNGEVDPTHLVPAQTNVDIPGQSPSDLVPLIPAPPLLTTHRILQARLYDLEMMVKETKSRKQQLQDDGHQTLNPMTEDDINHRILQYSRQVAETKQILNRVRTIYMSAATIPTIMHFKAHITAYQITQIEAAIFNAIPPSALMSHSAKQPHPRIVASTDFFNYFTRMIEHSILFPQEASARAQLMHYWIKVASRCLDLNNYQSLKAIVSALGTPPVERLRRTWAYIPKKSVTKLETLGELMSEADNYGRYREQMGMVNTTVVNGKSVAQVRAEHYAKPTIPFLGTFIHDITYLLAAFKSSPANESMAPEDEPRIHEVLGIMQQFQQGPKYQTGLPGIYNKAHQKHHFRPALSNALHRGASGIGRLSSNGIFGFGGSNGNGRDSTDGNSMISGYGAQDDDKEGDETEDGDMEEQQEMVTQYLLMRPWVNQETVDQLSLLREPPRQKTNTMNGTGHRSSGGTGGQTNSVISNSSSSVIRNSNGNISLMTSSSSGGSLSRPTSVEDEQQTYRGSEEYHTRHSTGSGGSGSGSSNSSGNLWPFRRSNDQMRPTTLHDPSGTPIIHHQPSPTTSSPLSTTSTHAPPIVPPRPPNMTKSAPIQHQQTNDEFKAVLAQRLAKAASDAN